MQCEKCGGQWIPPKGKFPSLDNCPFCGATVLNIEKARSLVSLSDFLQYLVSIYGIEIYNEKHRLYGFIADLFVCDEKMMRVYRRAILEDSLSLQVYELLLKSKSKRRFLFDQMVSQFIEMNFYEQIFSLQIVYAFTHGINIHMKYYAKETDSSVIENRKLLYCKALYNQGNNLYFTAKVIEGLYRDTADEYYNKAKRGNRKALSNLHCCYQNIKGIKPIYEKAIQWYRRAIDFGSKDAEYQISICNKELQRINRYCLKKEL